MSLQYGELRLTSGWDRFGSLAHPIKFQRLSRIGIVTARHSSTRRQPNFAALNRGRHLYSAGRPSRWVLAHILVEFRFHVPLDTKNRSFWRCSSAPRQSIGIVLKYIGSRPSDHYFRSVCWFVCLFVCAVFLNRLWSDFDQTRTYVICLGLVVSPTI